MPVITTPSPLVPTLPGEVCVPLTGWLRPEQADGSSELTGISQAIISAMENGRQQIGRDRAILLAPALKGHPAVITFPNFQSRHSGRLRPSTESGLTKQSVV